MSLPSKKKSSKREDQRRLATYKVNNCRSERRLITQSEQSAFVKHIEGNNCSQFGIVRLCTLELDILYPNPNKPWEKSTIIRFAARLGRDAIIAALLRGGADPTVFSCTCGDDNENGSRISGSCSSDNSSSTTTTSTSTSNDNNNSNNNNSNNNNNTDNNSSNSSNKNSNSSSNSNTNNYGINGASSALSAATKKNLSLCPFPLAVYIIRFMVRLRTKYMLRKEEYHKYKKQEQFWNQGPGSSGGILPPVEGPGIFCEYCKINNNDDYSDNDRYNSGSCVGNDGRKNNDSNDNNVSSPINNNHNHNKNNDTSNNNSHNETHLICQGECSLLVMDSCGHICCESCFLKHAVMWIAGSNNDNNANNGNNQYEGCNGNNDNNEEKEDNNWGSKNNDDADDITCPICRIKNHKINKNHELKGAKSLTSELRSSSTFTVLKEHSTESKERSRSLYMKMPEHLAAPSKLRSNLSGNNKKHDDNSDSDDENENGNDDVRTYVHAKKSKFRALTRAGIAKIHMGNKRLRYQGLFFAVIFLLSTAVGFHFLP